MLHFGFSLEYLLTDSITLNHFGQLEHQTILFKILPGQNLLKVSIL